MGSYSYEYGFAGKGLVIGLGQRRASAGPWVQNRPVRPRAPFAYPTGRRCQPSPAVPSLALRGSAGPGKSDSGSSGDSCGQRIAAAFIAACMPSNKPYADQLSDFSREVLQAYKRGFSLTALQLEMGGADTTAVLGRPLQSDEVELRSVWLALAYKTMRYLGLGPGDQMGEPSATGESSSAFDRDRLDDFVQGICIAAEKGYDQKRIQLEQSLNPSSSSSSNTALENAILQQSIRIVLTTIAVAKE